MTSDPTPDPMQSAYIKRPDARRHLKVLETLRKWDPIGVAEMPGGCDEYEDEYDSYAPGIIRMLDANATKVELVNALEQIALVHMGLSYHDRDHAFACVEELIEFWQARK